MSRPDIDLLSAAFYAGDARPAYAWIRDQGGLWYDEANEIWGIASYDAVLAAERDPGLFSSAEGSRPRTGRQPSMINMDDPEHKARRALINRGFTPRRVADRQQRIEDICDAILDNICQKGAADFVETVAAPLPLIVVGDLLAVLPEDRDTLLRWSDDMVASQGALTDEVMDRAMTAFQEYYGYAMKVIASRRAEPVDDLIGVLVTAEPGGEPMEDLELAHELLLLLIGGDETTRHVLASGVAQLLREPAQWAALSADHSGIPRAVEEMLRWASPVKNMNRTLTRDAEFFGASLKAGQQALLLYEGANFDPTHFADPDHFDTTRSPNEHVAFGSGPHYCLGASLARLELVVMVERLLTRLPDLRLADPGPVANRMNSFITGPEELPVVFTPTSPVGVTV